jgi:WhiB family redox-sensing transcriptional regulator
MTIEQQAWPYAPDWQRDAACKGTDPEVFFPEPGSGNAAIAKRICRDCPVQLDCGMWAIDTDQPIGIFGGMTANQRKRRLRELNRLRAARRAA